MGYSESLISGHLMIISMRMEVLADIQIDGLDRSVEQCRGRGKVRGKVLELPQVAEFGDI